jgi:FkbM family methyltransferase
MTVVASNTQEVTLNAHVCGVVLLAEDGQAVVSPEPMRETMATLRAAIEFHTGGFHRIEIIAPSADTTYQASLRQSVIRACQAECGWVFVVTSRCSVHREVFHRGVQGLKTVEGLWGTMIDQQDDGALSLRTPQLPTANSIDDLVMYPWNCCMDAGFFIRADILYSVVTTASFNDLASLCLELWSRAKCQKQPLQLVNLKPAATPTTAAQANQTAQRQAALKTQRGLVDGSLAMMHKRNVLTSQMQDLARQSAATVNYFAASRQAPWCGYYEVKQFEGQPFTLFSQNDDLCSLSLQWTGEYEAASTYVWQKLAQRAKLVLDIGAYTGLYSLLASRANPACRVVGFEPLSRNYARFLQNVQLNQMGNVSAVRAAAGKQHGQIGLSIYSNGEFLTSGASIVSTAGRQPVDVETVPLVSIDAVLESNRLGQPELIKIDAEGAELQVLSGMSRTLAAQPDLLMECLTGSDCMSLEQILSPFGYRYYAINESSKTIEPTDSLTASSGSLHDLNRLISTKTPEQLADVMNGNAGVIAKVA